MATVVPFDVITELLSRADMGENTSVLRLLRVMRVLKLTRILRASRIFSRWQDYIGLRFATVSLIQFSVLTVLLAHWLACAWGFFGITGITEPWMGYDGNHTWVQKAMIPASVTPYEMYAISIYVALNNIFGGSCEINPGAFAEFGLQAIMLLVGSSVWAYVIGSAYRRIASPTPALPHSSP